MSAVKSCNTKPEIWLRQRLHRIGYRYRISCKGLPGKPDLVFTAKKKAIFVNGCYWHMHDCPLFVLPKTRTKFWVDKLQSNKLRDQRVLDQLAQLGWRTLVIWECAIRGRLKLSEDELIALVTEWIDESYQSSEITGNY